MVLLWSLKMLIKLTGLTGKKFIFDTTGICFTESLTNVGTQVITANGFKVVVSESIKAIEKTLSHWEVVNGVSDKAVG
jgi:uncharacterized protein YlzI (FlbEa/FlbD family)